MNKNIVLDLDGVIADIASSIDDALSSTYGVDRKECDYSSWLTTEHHCEISDKMMGNSLFWRNLKPFKDAWHQINSWFSNGYDVYIVTARRTEHSINVTEQWLDEWKIATMPPIFAKMGEKHNIINKLMPLFVVEDNPNEVITLLNEGHNAFLRKAWYNEEYWKKLPTIDSLLELNIND